MLQIIKGGKVADERGTVSFVNDFHFDTVKRFYVSKNCKKGFIRAWHGHRREAKYVFVVSGSALVGAVNLETSEIHQFVLNAEEPQILHIPPGYANGFQSLTENTHVLFFATATLEESSADSIRYPRDTWNIWNKNLE
jgi:dTDP-4-dehydrorhamnose 3,5-epimerase-like enzyme